MRDHKSLALELDDQQKLPYDPARWPPYAYSSKLRGGEIIGHQSTHMLGASSTD